MNFKMSMKCKMLLELLTRKTQNTDKIYLSFNIYTFRTFFRQSRHTYLTSYVVIFGSLFNMSYCLPVNI